MSQYILENTNASLIGIGCKIKNRKTEDI